MALALTLFIGLAWFLPVCVAHDMGRKRNRTGWPYGLLLGWLGVGILALTSYLPTETERRVRELDAQRRLAELGEEPPRAKTGVLGSFGFDR